MGRNLRLSYPKEKLGTLKMTQMLKRGGDAMSGKYGPSM